MITANYLPDNQFFSHLPEIRCYLENAIAFIQNLYGNNRQTRKHLYAVAFLLGHSAPDISMEYYIHWCDVLLTEFMHREAKQIKKIDKQVGSNLVGLLDRKSLALSRLTFQTEEVLEYFINHSWNTDKLPHMFFSFCAHNICF